MKGYTKPPGFTEGICFICMQPCEPEAYCHFACAVAYSDERERKIKEAKELSKDKGTP